MTNSWRPEGWINPHNLAEAKYPHQGLFFLPDGSCIEGSYANAVGKESFEAGADAILKALREQHPCFVDEKEVASISFPLGKAKGYFVFIPDDEEGENG